jgi:hypothetical protein
MLDFFIAGRKLQLDGEALKQYLRTGAVASRPAISRLF